MKLRIDPSIGMSTQGTKIYLDDQEIKGVTGITLVGKLNSMWRCTLDLNVIVEGLQVDATTLANETRYYRGATRMELIKALFRSMVPRR